MNDCIFCKIANGKVKVSKVYENNSFLAFPDANPRVKGHTLIVPKKHFASLTDIPKKLGEELLDALKNTADIVMKENGVNCFNIIQNNGNSAGQVVMHVHFHIFPRKNGDRLTI
jgi:histidine triad (HIT) family protein